ncbi:uncharacterized protein LOC107473830 [Arachis duranensis]|uniref:Uncharacterized protein LOC107473830 n=1 Tax=Arachis duranensis TaxID=130453 RepID=A0A6P4CCP5_ARADU|nr:uncharacterized protein LOC107473830 [Arachis duranensis]
MDEILYASVVGSLMYAMVCTRPDIAYAVGTVSYFLSNPGKENWNVVKWIMRYFKGTTNLSLSFGGEKPLLVGFTDADMAGDIDSRNSTSGYLVKFVGELFHGSQGYKTLDFKQDRYVLLCDSQSAIHLAKNSTFHARSKHIDVRYHWIWNVLDFKLFELEKVHTNDNGADMMTKALSKEKLETYEVKIYYDCRYISSCESDWRIFTFDIHYRRLLVERLNFHLPDEQPVIFEDQDNLQRTIDKATIKESMFIAWFQANTEYEAARQLTYNNFSTEFVWKHSLRIWEPRKTNTAIGRLFFVPPSAGELYYLRMLLNIVKGPRSYEELRSFNGVVYPTFRDACYAHGLLDDDQEYIDTIEEASHWSFRYYLRKLFATLLWSNSMTWSEVVWQKCWTLLSDGILHNHITMFNLPDLVLSDDELSELTLIEIEKIFNSNGKTLREYATMLFPNTDNIHSMRRGSLQNKLILDELRYYRVMLAKQHKQFLSQMTTE